MILSRGLIKIKLWVLTILYPQLNLFTLAGLGAKVGMKCNINGRMSFRISRSAKMHIGDNLRITNSNLINPLCNCKSCLAVSDNASLIIGNNVGMSSPTLYVQENLYIGNHVNLGGGCIVLDSDCHSLNYLDRREGSIDQKNKRNKGIVIEDDVLVGAYSIILKGVHIGARSVIGAGSVVTKDIPADCIAAGNPCKIIRRINNIE